MDVDLDGEFVARQVTGLAEDRVGLAGAGQGVPGEELLVAEGAPEVAGGAGGGAGGGLWGRGGVAGRVWPGTVAAWWGGGRGGGGGGGGRWGGCWGGGGGGGGGAPPGPPATS